MSASCNARRRVSRWRVALCVFMTAVLVSGLVPTVPRAYAASTDKPDSVMLRIGSSNWKEIEVAKRWQRSTPIWARGSTSPST
jgi:hypothetical protein